MNHFLQTASNLWEHAKDTVVDTIGKASDRVLPESFIEDSQSKAILDTFDLVLKQSQEIIKKVQNFKQQVSNLATCYANMSSFSVIIPDQKESESSSIDLDDDEITSLKNSIEKYKHLSDFLANISEVRIPNEIEKDFDDIITRIRSKTDERGEFSQNCLKLERLRKNIQSAAESSLPDRMIELQHIEQDVRERVSALKQILAAESKLVDEKFTEARKNTLKRIIEYEKESFKQLE